MPKSYTDELAEWVESRAAKKRRRDEAAVAFLAVRADVEAALASGYALVTIWEHMRETGKVKFSYETFRSHARRHIKAKPADVPAPQAKAAEPAPAPKTPEPRRPKQGGKAEKPAPAAAPTGFTFNPTPDKKDPLRRTHRGRHHRRHRCGCWRLYRRHHRWGRSGSPLRAHERLFRRGYGGRPRGRGTVGRHLLAASRVSVMTVKTSDTCSSRRRSQLVCKRMPGADKPVRARQRVLAGVGAQL